MNDKGLYIIIAAVFFSPLALLFYIEWYWVFLIYNIFWAVLCYAAHSQTKNPKISSRNAFLIPLIFNLIGFGYVALKLNDDDDEAADKEDYSTNISFDWPKNQTIKELEDTLPLSIQKIREKALTIYETSKRKDPNKKNEIEPSKEYTSKGLKIALIKKYYSNGNLEFIGNVFSENMLKNKALHGYAFTYYSDGNFNKLCNYNDSELEGMYLSYYPNGFHQNIYNYKNGEFHGPNYWYYEKNEQKNIELNFNNGLREGKCLHYYESGGLKMEGEYKNDVPVGIWKWYDENGKVIKSGLPPESKENSILNNLLDSTVFVGYKDDSEISDNFLETKQVLEKDSNIKPKEKMFLEHEILNGSLTFWDEDYKNSIEIICELHSLKEEGKVWNDELNIWENGYTEEIDSFYLTTVNDKKYRFDEDELCSFLNKEESPVFDSGSFSFDECGINDEDDNETRQKKWDEYKAKFTKATSLEHFEINGYPNQEETKDEILNTKLKERKILSHQILTKGEFYYMLENETVSVFAQQHTLEKVIQEYEDEEWHTVDREFVDEFYLTDYEKGYRFEEVDLSKLIKIEESPDFESDGVSYDWCGIEEEDDNETRQKKWDDYKAKFPKATSIEHFDIENKKS